MKLYRLAVTVVLEADDPEQAKSLTYDALWDAFGDNARIEEVLDV